VQHRIFNHANRITGSVANFQVLDRSQNYGIFNIRTVVWPLKYLSQYNSLLFLTPCRYLSVLCLSVWLCQALLNPVQPVLNCLMYHHVSTVWHDTHRSSTSRHSNPLSTASEIPPESPLLTWQPIVNANPSSPLLIFGDSWRHWWWRLHIYLYSNRFRFLCIDGSCNCRQGKQKYGYSNYIV